MMDHDASHWSLWLTVERQSFSLRDQGDGGLHKHTAHCGEKKLSVRDTFCVFNVRRHHKNIGYLLPHIPVLGSEAEILHSDGIPPRRNHRASEWGAEEEEWDWSPSLPCPGNELMTLGKVIHPFDRHWESTLPTKKAHLILSQYRCFPFHLHPVKFYLSKNKICQVTKTETIPLFICYNIIL